MGSTRHRRGPALPLPHRLRPRGLHKPRRPRSPHRPRRTSPRARHPLRNPDHPRLPRRSSSARPSPCAGTSPRGKRAAATAWKARSMAWIAEQHPDERHSRAERPAARGWMTIDPTTTEHALSPLRDVSFRSAQRASNRSRKIRASAAYHSTLHAVLSRASPDPSPRTKFRAVHNWSSVSPVW